MPGSDRKETSISSPMASSQPYLDKIMSQADTLYGKYKNKPLLAPMNSATKEGLNQTMDLARQGVPNMDALYGYQSSMLSNGGMTPGMNQAAGILGGYAANNGMTSDLQESAGYLKNFANGSYNEDPRLLSVVNAEREKALNSASTRLGGGRYGSAAIGTGFSNAASQATDQLMLQSNENSRNRQLQASGILGDMYQSAANRGASAAGAMGSLYSQGADNMSTAAALAPTFNALRYDPASRMAGVGDVRHQYSQSKYDAPFDRLAQAAGYITPIAGMGKVVNSTKDGPSAAQGILGGAFTGGRIGSSFGPWGTLAGVLGGGILGGFS
ncbi:hypothetical protein KBI52_10990 [Microvirga sp. HBU67558]|uniref:hypothetical protein n=1 Tax=Microvirga sp. HBU67558 TaxID=2824562 RepID=UPI001B37B6C6|nr:hypothetical protein [Microvirga sp. HBU67558]MBQ0820731.1 hypothetical protein [Microvirga sp. HBU67558]